MQTDVTLKIIGDEVYKYTPIVGATEEICKREKVMDKDTFVECFNRWIKENEDADSD